MVDSAWADALVMMIDASVSRGVQGYVARRPLSGSALRDRHAWLAMYVRPGGGAEVNEQASGRDAARTNVSYVRRPVVQPQAFPGRALERMVALRSAENARTPCK